MEDQVSTYHLPLKLICSVLKLPRDPHLKQKRNIHECAIGRQLQWGYKTYTEF